ncbi:hypothetical protein D3C84_630260 [compost metagenome]
MPEGFKLLRLEQLGAHFIELQCGLAAVGNVAGYLRQPHDFAIGCPDHVQRHQCPEQRAVLAHAPAFILGTASTQGTLKQPVRLAVGTILRGEEHREMLADHFIGTIALDALCAGIPGHHVTFEVEHVDSVINHRLYQLLEATGMHHMKFGVG